MPSPPPGEHAPTDALERLLSDPRCYPDRPDRVDMVQTHISRVFLTERFAYKLKKAVHYDFVDFRQPEQRRAACDDEVALNRRLAPEVYLGVVPITRDRDGRLQLGGTGEAVDWVVQMRRLPDDRSLQAMLRDASLAPADLRALAVTLTDFYTSLPPLRIAPEDYRRRLLEHVRANREALSSSGQDLSQPLVQRAHAGQLRWLALTPEAVEDRAVAGRIVEGHGDLRPEHIYFLPRPTIIDCLEFSRELRQLDVLDELSFLAMECDYRGAADVGDPIIEHYCRTSGDRPPPALTAFYKSYRAAVRAKVAALRADQRGTVASRHDRGTAERYLQLAAAYAAELGPPLVLIMRGSAGTGKSTVAAALADRLGLTHLRTDAIRRQLFQDDAASDTDQRYRDENRQRVYARMLREADRQLADGLPVVLDGTFLIRRQLRAAAALARRHGALARVLECRCPAAEARQRIAARQRDGDALSEATPDVHQHQQQQAEPVPDDLPICRLDTTAAVADLLNRVFDCLRHP